MQQYEQKPMYKKYCEENLQKNNLKKYKNKSVNKTSFFFFT